ncbi:hypothetical protein, partial [Segatella bryantii]|uniref:hypothetical protein n=1 Tax=Segatella bryantii TaxID=77095 RepID=UPI00242F225B
MLNALNVVIMNVNHSLHNFYAKKTKASANWWQRSWKNAVINKKLCYWVWTELSTLASLTEFTHPYFIELVH